jgi:hypothetical protein
MRFSELAAFKAVLLRSAALLLASLDNVLDLLPPPLLPGGRLDPVVV